MEDIDVLLSDSAKEKKQRQYQISICIDDKYNRSSGF